METLVPVVVSPLDLMIRTPPALCDTTRIVVQCTGGGVTHDGENSRVLWFVDTTHNIY